MDTVAMPCPHDRTHAHWHVMSAENAEMCRRLWRHGADTKTFHHFCLGHAILDPKVVAETIDRTIYGEVTRDVGELLRHSRSEP
jgi:hypothetical protein